MDKDIANTWTAALRSGDYPQGQGALCDGKAFCCLGVLVEQFMAEFPGIITRKDRPVKGAGAVYHFENLGKIITHTEVLPPIVSEWAGITSSTGRFGEGFGDACDEPRVLVNLNDDGLTFNQIADTIDNFSELL